MSMRSDHEMVGQNPAKPWSVLAFGTIRWRRMMMKTCSLFLTFCIISSLLTPLLYYCTWAGPDTINKVSLSSQKDFQLHNSHDTHLLSSPIKKFSYFFMLIFPLSFSFKVKMNRKKWFKLLVSSILFLLLISTNILFLIMMGSHSISNG